MYCVHGGKGETNDPGNRREIALISTSSKNYSRALANRSNDWFEKRGIVTGFQVDFRKDRRTADNIFILRKTIDKCLGKKMIRVYGYLLICRKRLIQCGSQCNPCDGSLAEL